MIIGLAKFVVTLGLNGYVLAPICVDACNAAFKGRDVDERVEVITRGVVAVGGVITSAVIADTIVDALVKKGTEEAVKGFIRAII